MGKAPTRPFPAKGQTTRVDNVVALPTSHSACRIPATGGKPVTMPANHRVPAPPGHCRTRGQGPSFVSAGEAVTVTTVEDIDRAVRRHVDQDRAVVASTPEREVVNAQDRHRSCCRIG